MRRDSRRPNVVPGFDGLEIRSLLASGALAPGDPVAILKDASPADVLGIPRPSSSAARPLLVAVVGSGIDLNPSDPVHFLGGPNFLDLADAYNAVDGTYGAAAVADLAPGAPGTTSANNVAHGIADGIYAGGNPNVQVVPIDVYAPDLRNVPPYALINGIYHAVDLGVGVIDVGYVGTQFALDPGLQQQLNDALGFARASGVAVVAAAGNGFEGTSPVGLNVDQPGTSYGIYPADAHLANMLVATATDPGGKLAPTANWGPTHVDLGAPAVPADGSSASAAGYASGVAAVVAATRSDWSGIEVVNRIKQAVQPSAALAGKVTTGGVVSAPNALRGIYGVAASHVAGDYEGDLKSDLVLYGNVPGVGYTFGEVSSTQGFDVTKPVTLNNMGTPFGGPGAIPVPGRYYGGTATEPAILTPEYGPNGLPDGKYDFAILGVNPQGISYVTTFVPGVGGPGDIPVAADFSGSGRDDLALYGLHNGQYNFQVLTAASGFDPAHALYLNNNGFSLGGPGSVPVVGDFFGDGVASPGIYGPEYAPNGQPTGRYVFAALDSGSLNSRFQYTRAIYVPGFGGSGDVPVAADFDGDGRTDVALYGNNNGHYDFAVLASSTGFNINKLVFLDANGTSLGGPGYIPVVGDYFGDGVAAPAVYGPEIGPNGQPDGVFNFYAFDPGSLNARFQYTRGLAVRNFGGASAIPAAAPPVYRYYKAILG